MSVDRHGEHIFGTGSSSWASLCPCLNGSSHSRQPVRYPRPARGKGELCRLRSVRHWSWCGFIIFPRRLAWGEHSDRAIIHLVDDTSPVTCAPAKEARDFSTVSSVLRCCDSVVQVCLLVATRWSHQVLFETWYLSFQARREKSQLVPNPVASALNKINMIMCAITGMTVREGATKRQIVMGESAVTLGAAY